MSKKVVSNLLHEEKALLELFWL